MTKPKKVLVTKERTIHAYSELWHASSCTLEKGLNEAKASSWQFLTSIMLTAFTFEACLNYIGTNIFSCWDDIERLSPSAKFSLLCEKLNVDFPQGMRPRNTISELFVFRNSIAHGKSETIKASYKRDNDDSLDTHLGERLLSDWEKKIQTSDFAKRVREDVEATLKKLYDACPEPKEDLFAFGMGLHGAKLE